MDTLNCSSVTISGEMVEDLVLRIIVDYFYLVINLK